MEDFAQTLQKLRLSYQRMLPEKIESLRQRLSLLEKTPEKTPEEEILLVHTLRGTAGSYGFIEFSESMKVLEETLSELADLPVSLHDMLWLRMKNIIKRVEKNLENLSQTP